MVFLGGKKAKQMNDFWREYPQAMLFADNPTQLGKWCLGSIPLLGCTMLPEGRLWFESHLRRFTFAAIPQVELPGVSVTCA
jgi:hypothetical protein